MLAGYVNLDLSMSPTPPQEFSEAALVQLREDVAGLSCTAHGELFRLVCKHSVRYSRNNNGVFFCVSGAAGEAQFLKEVLAFVRFCCDHREQLDEYERTLQSRKLGGGGGGDVTTVVSVSSASASHLVPERQRVLDREAEKGLSAMAWLRRNVEECGVGELAALILGQPRQASWTWCAEDDAPSEDTRTVTRTNTSPAGGHGFLEPVPYVLSAGGLGVTSLPPECASG